LDYPAERQTNKGKNITFLAEVTRRNNSENQWRLRSTTDCIALTS